jgi:hypothetical protein
MLFSGNAMFSTELLWNLREIERYLVFIQNDIFIEAVFLLNEELLQIRVEFIRFTSKCDC